MVARKRSFITGRVIELNGLLDQFFLLSTARDKKTQEHYKRAVRWLGDLLGRQAQVSDLTDDHVRALLAWLQQTRRQTATTANGTHKCICRLWRWARDRGAISTGPTVPKLREPARTPQAWTRDELRRLVAAASTSPGCIGGMPAALWWQALLALSWDTGCRAAELLAVRWEWVEWERRWLRVPAESRKGGRRDAVYGLMEDTVTALELIRQTQGPILGDVGHRSAYYRLWDDLLVRAGLPTGRKRKTQMLRRSFASHLLSGGGDPAVAIRRRRSVTRPGQQRRPAISTRH